MPNHRNPHRGQQPRRAHVRRANNLPRATAESTANTAENRTALAISRAFRGPNNKYINTTQAAISSSSTVITAPYVFTLNAVAQGTTENTRIGRLVKNRWLDLDLDIWTGPLNQTFGVRVYIVAETTALGSALSPSQFFVDASNFSPYSQRDRTSRNASRYVVLWDSKPFPLGGAPVSTALGNVAVNGISPQERIISIHLPLKFSTDYSRGSAGTIADIDTNSLTLLVVTDNTSSGALAVSGGYTLCFNDDS